MVKIEQFTEPHLHDPDGSASAYEFHEARNAIVRTCKLHGPTGPMGEFPFDLPEDEDCFRVWYESGDHDPAYFVIDDQYNSERYQYIEISDEKFFTENWIVDVMSVLSNLPGWGLCIKSIPGGYAILFKDKIMVRGSSLEKVHDLSSFVVCVHEAFRNKDKYVKQRRSGSCKEHRFEDDRLVCTVSYFFVEGGDTLKIGREDVEKVWRNPFTGVGMLSLKDESLFELADDDAFSNISEWFDRHPE
jgi:hypothetical protein